MQARSQRLPSYTGVSAAPPKIMNKFAHDQHEMTNVQLLGLHLRPYQHISDALVPFVKCFIAHSAHTLEQDIFCAQAPEVDLKIKHFPFPPLLQTTNLPKLVYCILYTLPLHQ